ncbi:hypothetical protein BSL78_23804 [Apostichopus japonicus]|uniref:ATP-dependent DNA helicase n=1 Tax=Stichopus japonicus TaxID=307972 RepID=A0A2G8JUF2_STIJA|nr:hypothetical protein BSL78_23804 [Apostichopus japonicus]
MQKTMLLYPIKSEITEAEYGKLTQNFLNVSKLLANAKDGELNMTYDDFLKDVDLSEEEYIQAIRSSIKTPTIFLERTPAAIRVNCYMKNLLGTYGANHDIQFVTDPYACAVYIVAYMSKSQRGMSLLLDQACKEAREGNSDVRKQVRIIGNKFVNAVESKEKLEEMNPDATDIECGNVLKRYATRPKILEQWSLVDYVSKLNVHFPKELEDKYSDDYADDPTFQNDDATDINLPTNSSVNITLPSAFSIDPNRGFNYKKLNGDKLNTLQVKYANLKVVIIDEISMMSTMMINILTEPEARGLNHFCYGVTQESDIVEVFLVTVGKSLSKTLGNKINKGKFYIVNNFSLNKREDCTYLRLPADKAKTPTSLPEKTHHRLQTTTQPTSLLVCAAVPPLTSNPHPFSMVPSNVIVLLRCIVCSHHIVESNSITSHSMQLTHKTKGHITCTTTNVIYLISCRVCGIQYVAKPKTLKKRFYGHRSTDNTMKTETPVGEHFNLPNHTINDMSPQGIESLGSRPDLVRISRERLWMQRLRTIQPHGLNIQEGHD